MVKYNIKRYIAILLSFVLCLQSLTACSNAGQDSFDSTIANETQINETFITETFIDEEKISEAYIIENFVYEDLVYEYKLDENIISQAYIIQTVVSKNTEAEVLEQLPEEIENYDIDWTSVVSKFAVGTSIIIAVGVVNYVSGGSTFFVFGSPVTVAKDALIGGAMGIAINEVVDGVKDGKLVKASAKKYAIEGFTDGYMWGLFHLY